MSEEEKKPRFYFRGVFYDTYEELINSHNQFYDSKISPMSMKEMLDGVMQDIILNIMNHEVDMTNAEFSERASRILGFALDGLVSDISSSNCM